MSTIVTFRKKVLHDNLQEESSTTILHTGFNLTPRLLDNRSPLLLLYDLLAIIIVYLLFYMVVGVAVS